DVVVRIDASGVCHTDAAVLHGHLPWDAPSILGHEVAGTVVEIGSGVDRVHVGDRVISSGLPACGNCFSCVRGQSHLCEFTFQISATPRARRGDGTSVPAFASLGGFADVMTVPEFSIVPVRTELPAEQLALIGCAITTGIGSVFNTAQMPPGASVTMVGMPPADSTIAFNGLELFLDAKQIRVSNMGSSQIRRDFPRYVALAETSRLDIASMISRRIVLDDVNDAFRSMDAGEVIRTVIT